MTVSIPKIYFYAVSLITLVMIIMFSIQAINSIVEIAMPETYYEQTPDSEIRTEIVRNKYGPSVSEKEIGEKTREISDEEVKEYRERKVAENKRIERNRNIKRLITNILALCVVIPFYLFHFRKARTL